MVGGDNAAAMSSVVHLKWGEEPKANDPYVMITRLGRIRGEDYYVHTRSNRTMGEARSWADESFASLASALRQAETVATSYGAEIIYVRLP
jgi:hypothetical protein